MHIINRDTHGQFVLHIEFNQSLNNTRQPVGRNALEAQKVQNLTIVSLIDNSVICKNVT